MGCYFQLAVGSKQLAEISLAMVVINLNVLPTADW
jgi:hypothetical protein